MRTVGLREGKKTVNNGINYQPQLVLAFFSTYHLDWMNQLPAYRQVRIPPPHVGLVEHHLGFLSGVLSFTTLHMISTVSAT